LASGGSMDFPLAQVAKLPADELFANGGHTDYGIALQSDAGTIPTQTGLTLDLKTAAADVTHQVVDSASPPPKKVDDHTLPTHTSVASDMTATFDHVGIHIHNLL